MRTLALISSLVALCPAGILAGDGVVALQTAEASCRDGSTAIYVDCGNGTVTDNRTGLVWLANADCLGAGVDWFTAMEFVAGLADITALPSTVEQDCGLTDGSSPGEWRLPSVAEWQAMVADADDLGCSPTITSDLAGVIITCWSAGCNALGLCAFSDVQSLFYWSSSSLVASPSSAGLVAMNSGNVSANSKAGGNFVWPVRGGQ